MQPQLLVCIAHSVSQRMVLCEASSDGLICVAGQEAAG